VNPVVLGSGHPMFKNADRMAVKLLEARAFASGNVLLTYRPAQTARSTP
jgi:dihydrofolate reductase